MFAQVQMMYNDSHYYLFILWNEIIYIIKYCTITQHICHKIYMKCSSLLFIALKNGGLP